MTLQSEAPVRGSSAIGRRGLMLSAAVAGLSLGIRGTSALAQDASLPENAAIWIRYNLNTASEDQLKNIPGAGDRMLREFLEYRPYTSIGQFRGEIGKYISPEEVAGLERYLFVPVDPNAADSDTLQQLPGVTPDIAQALIDGRPYDSADAFLTKLGESVTAEFATAAKTYLVQS